MSQSLACRICRAIIDCPKEEADRFVAAVGEALLGNSSSLLDHPEKFCTPCLQEARKKADEMPKEAPQLRAADGRLRYDLNVNV